MKIELKKFGEMLVSRPAGREAYLALSAYSLGNASKDEEMEIDFSGIKVLTPSWADEVLSPIAREFPHLLLTHTQNASVQATLKTLRKFSDFFGKEG